MKSVNYALLLMVSPFIIAGCGGSSSSTLPAQEASADDIAVQIEIQPSQEQAEADDVITATIETYGVESVTEYKKANWIPTEIAGSNKQFSKTVYIPSKKAISSKVESNGENPGDWYVYDHNPAGATIESKYDASRGSDVICLSGDGLNNGYTLGWKSTDWGDASTNKLMKWNNSTHNTIKWSMKYSEDYTIYVRVNTPAGYRYIYYTAANKSYGIDPNYNNPHYIHNGLGFASKDGSWRTFTRNLTADLKRFEPNNEITTIDGFFVRGSGCIDDVELLTTSGTQVNEIIYEDAQDGRTSRWTVYDNNPAGATIKNVVDAEKSSKVVEVCGTGVKNGFILGAWDTLNGWKNTINKEISWDMKFNSDYVIYLSVITAEGHRFMTYSPRSTTTCSEKGDGKGIREEGGYTYVHNYICGGTTNGTWQSIARNLEADLKKYEPNNSLVSVTAFLVRGCGRLDNIKMFDTNTNDGYDNSTN